MKGDLKLNNYPHFPTAFPNFSAQDGVRQFNTLPFSEGEQGYPTASPYGSSGYHSDDFGSYPFPRVQQGYPSTPPYSTPGIPSEGFGSYPYPGGQQGYPTAPPSGTHGYPSHDFGGAPFPGGGQQIGGAPTSPPPSFIPQQSVSLQAVDPGAIRRCLYRFTFIWLNNGRSFWFYPTFVGRNSVAGFRWRGNQWVYYGTDLQRIRSFQCF